MLMPLLFSNSLQTRRGIFQCEPILETLLIYYSSSRIMESPPTQDTGEGNRPVGALAMATAAVRHFEPTKGHSTHLSIRSNVLIRCI